MAKTEEAEFEVPARVATSAEGAFLWELAAWPGVKRASLDATLSLIPGGRATATLDVEATPKAMIRVRAFCAKKGWTENVAASLADSEKRIGEILVELSDPKAEACEKRHPSGGRS